MPTTRLTRSGWGLCLVLAAVGCGNTVIRNGTTSAVVDADAVADQTADATADAVPAWPQPQPGACMPSSPPQPACDPPHSATAVTSLCADGWCWRNPLPHGLALGQPWASSPSSVWMPAEGGTLLHFDGATWVRLPLPSRRFTPYLTGSGACDIWTKGDSLLHWQGKTWEPVEPPPKIYPGRIQALPDGSLLMEASDRFWWRIAGAWQPGATKAKWMTNLGPFWASGPSDIWQLGSQSGVMHWDGNTWELFPDPQFQFDTQIWGSGPADVFIGGRTQQGNAGVAHWTGAGWNVTELDAPLDVIALDGRCGSDVWASTVGGAFHFDGQAWTKTLTLDYQPGGNANCFPRVTALGAGLAMGGGQQGVSWTWNGTKWQPSHACDPHPFISAATDGASGLWLGGDVLRHWSPQASQDFPSIMEYIRAVAWSPSGLVIAGGVPDGKLRVARGDGQKWPEVTDLAGAPSTTGLQLTGLWSSGPQDTWLTATAGMNLPKAGPGQVQHKWVGHVFHSTEQGWTLLPVSIEKPMGVWSAGPDDAWVIDQSPTVLHWQGGKWQDASPPCCDNSILQALIGTGPNDLWVGGSAYAGKSPVSHWNGKVWQAGAVIAGPTVPYVQSMALEAGELWVAGDGWVGGTQPLTCLRLTAGGWLDGGCPIAGKLLAKPGGGLWLVRGGAVLERTP